MAESITYKQIISSVLKDSGGLAFERFNGDLALGDLDVPDVPPTRDINNLDILTDNKGKAIWNYAFSSMNNVITRIDLRYQKINPEDDRWGAVKFCTRSDGSETEKHNFLSEGSTYSNYLESAYDLLGEERAITVDAPNIRDEETAERLCKILILWRFRPLAMLNISCKYSVIDIEMLDKILVNAGVITGQIIDTDLEKWSLMSWPDGTTLPKGATSIDLNAKYTLIGLPYILAEDVIYTNDFLADRQWIVIGRRLVPNIKQKPKIILKLLEIGGSNIDVPEDWVDTFATGDEKIDGFTGSKIVEEKL